MVKTHRVIYKRDFNGTLGGYRFRNGVSEPMIEREAKRMATALSCRMEAIPSIEEEDAQVQADREDAGMAPTRRGKATKAKAKGPKTRSKAKGEQKATSARQRK